MATQVVKHMIPVDGIPREFTFQYEYEAVAAAAAAAAAPETKMSSEIDVLAIVKKEEKSTLFTIRTKKITTIWLYDRLEALHGKDKVGGIRSFGKHGTYYLVGSHEYLFPLKPTA